MKAEGVGVADEVENDDTASTAEITLLNSDEDGGSSDYDEVKSENKPYSGPITILYGGDGTSAHTLADEEDAAMECVTAKAEERRGEDERDEVLPSTEVVSNRRRNKCVPSSARLAKAMKDTQSDGVTPGRGRNERTWRAPPTGDADYAELGSCKERTWWALPTGDADYVELKMQNTQSNGVAPQQQLDKRT